MSKYTPGPWSFQGSEPIEGSDCFWILAGTRSIGVSDGYQNDPEKLANARLISAAPEMLEVLKTIFSEVEPTGSDQNRLTIDLRCLISNAIAKAEGGL